MSFCDYEDEYFSLIHVCWCLFIFSLRLHKSWMCLCACVCSWSDKGDELSQVACLFHQQRSDRLPGSYGWPCLYTVITQLHHHLIILAYCSLTDIENKNHGLRHSVKRGVEVKKKHSFMRRSKSTAVDSEHVWAWVSGPSKNWTLSSSTIQKLGWELT